MRQILWLLGQFIYSGIGNERCASELDDLRRIANSHKEEAKKLSEQLDAARIDIQDLESKEADSTKRWNELDENHQQTIALLVSEKTSLLASVARLEQLETGMLITPKLFRLADGLYLETQEKGKLLQAESSRSQLLDARVQDLERSSSQLNKQLEETLVRERELVEKSRDRVSNLVQICMPAQARSRRENCSFSMLPWRKRNLHLNIINNLFANSRNKSKATIVPNVWRSRLRTLRIAPKNLSFSSLNSSRHVAIYLVIIRCSQTKQTLASAKHEKDETQSQLQLRIDGEAAWQAKHAVLEQQHSSIQAHLHSTNQDRDALLEERASLQSQVDFNQSAIKQLQQKLGEVASELSSSDRALQNAHGDLRAAIRRAEEAERTQKDLQTEGTRLMQSLDEMRPKFVELTSNKMELMEQIDKLEHEKNSRDAFIAKLELALNEATDREAEEAKAQKDANSSQEKDKVSLQQAIAELQQGYAELQTELESSQAAVLSLEGDRTQLRQIEARQLEIIDRLSTESHQHSQAMSHMESDLRSYRTLAEEHRAFTERTNYQLETLQVELRAKDDEMEHLRTASSSNEAAPRSLDNEMLGAVKVQHTMDLSNAQSKIRALETAVFEAQAKSHNLLKQVSILEDQLAQQPRSASRATSRPFSPGVPGRPASRSLTHTDSRRASFTHRPSNLAPPSPRTVFDVGLSAETRHKRQVSLSMLKARIDREVAASAGGHPLSRQLSPVLQENEGSSAPERIPSSHAEHLHRRPQFMDESHIFWCHSCRGDLIIL